jgi:hypothetical protein
MQMAPNPLTWTSQYGTLAAWLSASLAAIGLAKGWGGLGPKRCGGGGKSSSRPPAAAKPHPGPRGRNCCLCATANERRVERSKQERPMAAARTSCRLVNCGSPVQHPQ